MSEAQCRVNGNNSSDNTAKMMWTGQLEEPTNMDMLRERINQKHGTSIESYKEFHQWSIHTYGLFWEEVFLFTNIVCSQPHSQVVDTTKNISEIPQWFEGCHLNYAENLLKWNDDRTAIYSATEASTEPESVSFKQLRERVAVYAAAMKKVGIKQGDRVVGYIPNCVGAVEAMLAAASIGAIWSSTSPDFGTQGVLDRFTQIQPRLIFSVNAVNYNGKVHNHLPKLDQVVKGLPGLEKVIVIPYVVKEDSPIEISHIRNSCLLDEFLALGRDESGAVPELTFAQLPFNHPLYIMYSSGTTGAPKCMVHSAGGTLLKHNEEHVIQGNAKRSDVIMYYTTTGWMMWNWLVGALAGGAAIVLYDGSPLVPSVNVMWDLVDKIGMTVLGTGAKWISVLEDKGVCPVETHSLASLHTILSTGSPLKPGSYDYVYSKIKQDLLLGSITGGTDIISCFAGQNWSLPVHRGEIQSANLGSAVESWDDQGKRVLGECGELVCTKPFPSMPTHFWNDPDGAKYKKAYFSKYPGVWAHGDFLVINPETGGIVMLGRSDGTLNPNGVRFGSAEIYNVVEAFKEVGDSVCVAQRSSSGDEERVLLFLKMAPGSVFSQEFVQRVKSTIRAELSARHMPAVILPISDIPYTLSGKKVEVAVRDRIAGKTVANRGALANPASLDLYTNIQELQGF